MDPLYGRARCHAGPRRTLGRALCFLAAAFASGSAWAQPASETQFKPPAVSDPMLAPPPAAPPPGQVLGRGAGAPSRPLAGLHLELRERDPRRGPVADRARRCAA